MMRLIDADKLHYIKITILHSIKEDRAKKDVVVFAKEIDKAPTVDVVPVIHAHPIFEYRRKNAKCSNCGNYTIGYDIDNWDNYCSHCGAKMDGDSNAVD